MNVFWKPNERTIIEMVRNHPLRDQVDLTNLSNKVKGSWKNICCEIAKDLGMNPRTLKGHWSDMYKTYAGIKSLIREEIVTEEFLKQHPVTQKYLDGTLSFLDTDLATVEGIELSHIIPNNDYMESSSDFLLIADSTTVNLDMVKNMIAIRENDKRFCVDWDNIDVEHIKNLLLAQVISNASTNKALISSETLGYKIQQFQHVPKVRDEREDIYDVSHNDDNEGDIENVIPENIISPMTEPSENIISPNMAKPSIDENKMDVKDFFSKMGDFVDRNLNEKAKQELVQKIDDLLAEILKKY